MDLSQVTWGMELEGTLPTQTPWALNRQEMHRIVRDRWGWTVHRDGSVGSREQDNSIELISPVFQGLPPNYAVRDQIEQLVRFCVGQQIRTAINAGVHMHVGSLSTRQFVHLIIQWHREEARWFTRFPPHPTARAHFVLPWHPDFHAEVERVAVLATQEPRGARWYHSRLQELRAAWYGIHQGDHGPAPRHRWTDEWEGRRGHTWDVARYHAFNLNSLDRHETLEFRLFPGTLKLERLIEYWTVVQGFLERADALEEVNVDALPSLS